MITREQHLQMLLRDELEDLLVTHDTGVTDEMIAALLLHFAGRFMRSAGAQSVKAELPNVITNLQNGMAYQPPHDPEDQE